MEVEETFQSWPLVLVIDDGYRPKWVEMVLEGVEALPEDAISLLWGFAGDRAREEVTLN